MNSVFLVRAAGPVDPEEGRGRRPRPRAAATMLVFAVLFAGCAAPFSDFQSARTAGRGKVEATASYSAVTLEDSKVQDQVGAHAGIGLTDNVDLRARYERIYVDDVDADAFQVFGAGPKVALEEGRAALYLPFGFAFGEDVETSDSWEFHPTLLLTQPVSPWIEIGLSFKMMFPLSGEGRDARYAANIGLGIGPERLSYIFRPEVGIMLVPDALDDPFFHFGIGFSLSSTDRERRVED